MKRFDLIWMLPWALLALAAPYFSGDYLLTILTMTGIYIITAQGLNVLLGFSGQISIGHAGFMAIGAYLSGLMAAHWTPSIAAIWAVVILANALVGFVLGAICLRMVGPYLALATIGFGVIVKVIATNWREVTGGPEGIIGIPSLNLGPLAFDNITRQYYLTLAVVAATLILVRNLRESRVGRAMLATRDDELAAQATGINVAWFKVLAFVLSAVLAGVAGSLYMNLTSTVFPEAFDLQLSALFVMILVIGGTGNIAGVTLGSLLIVGSFELLRELREYQVIVYSVAVILCIIYLPQGVMGFIENFLRSRGWSKGKALTVPSSLLSGKDA
jgi:branched-chain amino acid transport system permease protein